MRWTNKIVPPHSLMNQKHIIRQTSHTYPFEIEEIFLERLPGLSVDRLVGDVRVLLIATALVVLAAVGLPVPQAHPAKVKLTLGALLQATKHLKYEEQIL